ncbi:MAG: OmpA family protein [Oscillospiraceae bacterium]|nr:OmpA family protein [Oscillospiraceae bacterium]
MRRAYRDRTAAAVRSGEGEQGFWPSYADMMSAVALILFFVMLLSYIQNLITGNDLKDTKAALTDTADRLAAAQTLLDKTTLSLQETERELSGTRETLASTQTELSDTQASLSLTLEQVAQAEARLDKIAVDLDEAKLTLARQQEELAGQDKLLADQKALIADQEAYMKAASEELLAMRSQMQTIAVLRLSILRQIRDSMAKSMGDASKVSIGDNGNIVLSESILFDVGSSDIKDEAAPALDQLIDVFVKFLSDEENAKYVDSIVISGHTDSTGTEEDNRVLSTDRANAVLGYLLEQKGGKLGRYAEFFCAAGYGETRPVQPNDTPEGRSANRRIEISVILRDESVMQILESYLEIEPPATP